MTEQDLDLRLRARLDRLANAVPLAEAAQASTQVRRGPVVWVRGLPGRLTLAIGLVATVAVAVWAGGIGRPPGPASTNDQGIESVSIDGPFELTIRSTKAVYEADEPIEVLAALAYRGAAPGVVIFHGLGVAGGPLAFGVVEPVEVPGIGLVELVGGYRLSCVSSILDPAADMSEPFAKGGHPVDEGPGGPSFEEVQRYFSDRVLRLPPGTWHVYAVADFSVGGCGGERHSMQAELTIGVAAADGSIPTAPPPTPTADPGDLPIGADTQEGPIQLTLSSPHRDYRAGEAIDVIAGLGYWGDQPSVTTYGSSSLGPVAFWLRQLDGDVQTGSGGTADCVSQSVLRANEPVQLPFSKAALSVTGATGDFWQGWHGDPDLRLPTGTWEIGATTEFSLAPDCSVPGPVLRPSITIVVLP